MLLCFIILLVIGIMFVLLSGKLDKKFNGNGKIKKVVLICSMVLIVISIIGIVATTLGEKDNKNVNNIASANQVDNYLQEDGTGNMAATMPGVIMEVHDNSLSIMEIKDNASTEDLYNVSFASDGNIGFQQGQEVLIYFDGIVAATYPGQIYNVGKIEITKAQTDITIPDDVLRYYNNSKDNISIYISEISSKGITINITDKNDIPYEFSNNYIIYKEVKNDAYTGEGEQIGGNTGNSVGAFTGTGAEYEWTELPENSNINLEDTMQDLIYNLPNMTEENNYNVIGKKIDWTNLYGELSDGKYRLVFSDDKTPYISIEFTINNGNAEVTNQEIIV